MFVNRVPNTKVCTRSRSLVIACMKCRNMREYRLIEPEMSHRITSGGWRCWCERRRNGMTSALPRRLVRSVARRSTSRPRESGCSRRVAMSGIGRRRLAMSFLACVISSVVMVSKSLRRRASICEALGAKSGSSADRGDSRSRRVLRVRPSASASRAEGASRSAPNAGAASGRPAAADSGSSRLDQNNRNAWSNSSNCSRRLRNTEASVQ